jgi:hypothetical protein
MTKILCVVTGEYVHFLTSTEFDEKCRASKKSVDEITINWEESFSRTAGRSLSDHIAILADQIELPIEAFEIQYD